MRLSLTEQLLTAADAYCRHTGYARSTASLFMFNDGRTLDRVADGSTLLVRNWEQAMRWLSTYWPQDKPWPADVLRLDPLPAATVDSTMPDAVREVRVAAA